MAIYPWEGVIRPLNNRALGGEKHKYNLDKMTLAASHLITASPTSNIYVHATRKRCKLQVRHGCNRGRGEGTDNLQS